MAEGPGVPTDVVESDLSFKSINLDDTDATVVEMDHSIEDAGRHVYPTPVLPPRPSYLQTEDVKPKVPVPIILSKGYSPSTTPMSREPSSTAERDIKKLVESQTRLQQDIGKLMSLMVTLGTRDQVADSQFLNTSRNNGEESQNDLGCDEDSIQNNTNRQHDQFVSRMPNPPPPPPGTLSVQGQPVVNSSTFAAQPPTFVSRPPGVPYWAEGPTRDAFPYGPSTSGHSRHDRGYAWKSFPEADKFAGTENGENFEEWLTKFEFKCRFNGYDDRADLSDILLLALKDDALNYILGVPNYRDLTFPGLCRVLTKRFGADLAADRQRLQERRKRREESWQHFADDILRLCARVYPGLPELAEREAKNVFIDSLPNDMRMSISAANPPDLATCIASVKSICSHNPVKRVNWVDSTENFQQPGYPAVNSGTVRRRSDSPSPGRMNRKEYMKTVKCYNCGNFGHFARWCRQDPNVHAEQTQENDQES